MQPGTEKILAKALAAGAAARANLARGALDLAAARSYYAMFYAARALLSESGVRVRTHAEVGAALRRLGDLPTGLVALSGHLDAALRRRSEAASEASALSASEVADWVARAAGLAEWVAALLQGISSDAEGDEHVRGDEPNSGQ